MFFTLAMLFTASLLRFSTALLNCASPMVLRRWLLCASARGV